MALHTIKRCYNKTVFFFYGELPSQKPLIIKVHGNEENQTPPLLFTK